MKTFEAVTPQPKITKVVVIYFSEEFGPLFFPKPTTASRRNQNKAHIQYKY